MRTQRIDSYIKRLEELREIRKSTSCVDSNREKSVRDMMDVLWEAMTLVERDYISDNNHLSWPPPRIEEEEK